MVSHGPLVQGHELPLADGCCGLECDHRLRTLSQSEALTAQADGTAGHKNDTITSAVGPGDARGIALDHRFGGSRPIAAQQACPQLDHPEGHARGAPITRARPDSNRCTRSLEQGLPSSRTGLTRTV